MRADEQMTDDDYTSTVDELVTALSAFPGSTPLRAGLVRGSVVVRGFSSDGSVCDVVQIVPEEQADEYDDTGGDRYAGIESE